MKWKPEMEMEKEMMEMEKQMMEMQPPIRVVGLVGLARYVLLGFMPTLASQSPPPTSSFNCKLVVIICTLPYDRLLMSICCFPRLMSSVLCYYSCKVPFIRLAIWLAL